MKTDKTPPACLTIAGLDPSGGAGIAADIKTFYAFGCYAAAAVTSVTYQNTQGVFGAEHVAGDTLRSQLEPVFEDLDIVSVKTGMIPTAETIAVVAGILKEKGAGLVVVDPVVRSTSGFDLIDDESLTCLTRELFPLALVVTPNLQEAERIAGIPIRTADDFQTAADCMLKSGARNVLIKGGHAATDHSVPKMAIDRLYGPDGSQIFESEYIETTSTHGTGCTLSSAIAANLALGHDLGESVRISKDYVNEAIRTAKKIGKGHSPVNHWAGVKIDGER